MMMSENLSIKTAEQAGSDHDGDNRERLSPSRYAELSESRRREYTRRAREEHNSNLSAMSENEARVMALNANQEDLNIQFGLPFGEACLDIWEQIFQHVDDADDIANLCSSCVLFRDLLEGKYKTLRFIQVATKFANRFGSFNSLLTLRLVCKRSKAFVDKLLIEINMDCGLHLKPEPFDPYGTIYQVSPPVPCPSLNDAQEGRLQARVMSLEQLNLPSHTFPVKWICSLEVNFLGGGREWIPPAPNDPILPTFRAQISRGLELIGGNIRSFDFVSASDNVGAYNQLRDWVTLMPRLEELSVFVLNGTDNDAIAPVDLLPFPHCPRLKRYVVKGLEFCDWFVRRVFQANPGISDVLIHYALQTMLDTFSTTAPFITLNTMKLETFQLVGFNAIPPPEFLEFRFDWPLKKLSLLISGEDEEEDRETSSRKLFAFVNTFSTTLEELKMNWKIRDTGGSLKLPKVTKLCWKLSPGFMTLDFMTALENLQYLDVDVVACGEINDSFGNVKEFVDGYNLPSVFPAMRRIRVRMEAQGKWLQVWKS